MDRDEKIALGVFGGLLALVGGAIAWILSGSDDSDSGLSQGESDRGLKKQDADTTRFGAKKTMAFVPSDKKCDGVPYNAAQWPDKAAVAAGLRELGYSVTDVSSANGRDVVRAFQTRARSLKLAGMAGKSDAWIDGKVGACTLRALTAALELNKKGGW